MRTRCGIRIHIDDNCPTNNYFEFDYDPDFLACTDCGESEPTFNDCADPLCARCAKERYKVNKESAPCVDCGEDDEDDACYEIGGEIVCGECLLTRLI